MTKEPKIADLIEKVQAYYPAADVDIIRKAYEFSATSASRPEASVGRALFDSSNCGRRCDCRLKARRAQRRRRIAARHRRRYADNVGRDQGPVR